MSELGWYGDHSIGENAYKDAEHVTFNGIRSFGMSDESEVLDESENFAVNDFIPKNQLKKKAKEEAAPKPIINDKQSWLESHSTRELLIMLKNTYVHDGWLYNDGQQGIPNFVGSVYDVDIKAVLATRPHIPKKHERKRGRINSQKMQTKSIEKRNGRR